VELVAIEDVAPPGFKTIESGRRSLARVPRSLNCDPTLATERIDVRQPAVSELEVPALESPKQNAIGEKPILRKTATRAGEAWTLVTTRLSIFHRRTTVADWTAHHVSVLKRSKDRSRVVKTLRSRRCVFRVVSWLSCVALRLDHAILPVRWLARVALEDRER
jgi:hypothetical protein